jgi:hypothetical protein
VKGFEFGEAIGRLGVTRAICLWLAQLAGVLLRPKVLGIVAVGIAAGVWMNGGLPEIHWLQWSEPTSIFGTPTGKKVETAADQQCGTDEEVVASPTGCWRGFELKRLESMISLQPWKAGASSVEFKYAGQINGVDWRYWVMFRGDLESDHDSNGQQVTKECLHMYVRRIVTPGNKFMFLPPPSLTDFDPGSKDSPEVLKQCVRRQPGFVIPVIEELVPEAPASPAPFKFDQPPGVLSAPAAAPPTPPTRELDPGLPRPTYR